MSTINFTALARPLAAVGVLLLAACAHQPALTSRYAAAPIVVDGHTAEWPNELQYDPSSHLQYQVLNDQRTLYLRLMAADQPTQRLLLRGLTVWLDTTGHNHKQLGIHFPLGLPGMGRPRNGANGDDAQSPAGTPGERRRPQLSELREMELLNFHGQAEPLLTDNLAPLGVRAALDFDAQDNLVYELAVPLRVLYRRPPTSGKAIVGISLVGAQRPAGMAGGGGMSGAGGGGRGGRGGGMGGMGGGGMGGGGGMRGGGGMGGGMGGGGRMGGSSGGSQQTLNLKTSVQLTGQP